MVAVLDPAVLTGFHNGYFAASDEDDGTYLITDGGAIPVGASRGLTTLSDSALVRMGADRFQIVNGDAVRVDPESPVIPGTTRFDGLVMGTFHGESGMTYISLGVGLKATTGAVAAPFTSIAADGWQATDTTPSDLSLAPFTVRRAAFDATGVATAIGDTVYLTKRVRQAYPNQASFTADQVAVSDYIYAADTISGAVNNSTLVSPKPIAAWVMPHSLLVQSSVTWEIVAFHRDARLGRQVACVKVRANNGTDATAWQTVTATSVSTLCEDANPVEVYTGSLDVSAFANGAFWLEAEVYPWFGVAASVLKSEDKYAASAGPREFTRRWFKKGSVPAYCYVASTGNDTTGSANAVAATASGTPCLTVAGALKKLHDLLGTSAGALDGARIRVKDGVSLGTVTFTGSYKQDVAAVVIERDPNVSRATANVTTSANWSPDFDTSSVGPSEGQLLLYDVTLTLGGVHTFNGSTSPSHPLHVLMWNVALNMASNASTLRSTAHMSYFGVTMTNVAASGLNPLAVSGTTQVRMIRGVTANMAAQAHEGWVTIGSRLTATKGQSYADATLGCIFYNNKYLSPDGTQSAIIIEDSVGGSTLSQIAIVQNLIEWTSATASPSIRVSGDSDEGNTSHVVMHHNTSTGAYAAGRWNLLYDEDATVARTHELHSFKGNLGAQLNVKGDIFTSNAARLGNFAFVHGVGCAGTFTTHDPNSPSSEAQSYPGIGSSINAGSASFTDNQSTTYSGTYSAGAGGGTYTLGGGSAARGILSGPVLAFDLAGSARGSGAQAAGAYV